MRLLKQHLGEIAQGRFIGPRGERVLLRELCDDFLTDYRINGKRSLDKVHRSVRHVLEFFGDAKAREITTDWLKIYIAHR